ncbi:hypothetical protein [Streptomyces flavalbus]|uniref:Uncharacterized protein n=1 Tax=Streptomyces flavalbus TaxID=2665155 RepID=A0ABW2W5Q5_9ACTN
MSDATRPTGTFDENPDRGPGRREDVTGRGMATAETRGVTETHAAHVAEGATGTPGAPGTRGGPAAHGTTGTPHPATPLLPHEESEQLSRRMQHAVTGFVDGPRSAVEEADHALEEIAARFADAVTQRRRTLRKSWQETDEDRTTTADTEQLRLALRDYRELADRLLHQ